MYFENSYFTVAIYLSAFVGIFLVIFHWRNSVATESRLRRMMESYGISREIAENADQLLNVDMPAVRNRCRHCPVTDLCDHWLSEEAATSNSFCPNASVFRNAAGLRPVPI